MWEMGLGQFKIDSPRGLLPQPLDGKKSKAFFHAILTIRLISKHSPPNCELLVLFNVCISSAEAGAANTANVLEAQRYLLNEEMKECVKLTMT